MRFFRRSAFLRLVVLPFTLTMFLTACHKWTAVEPPYGPAIENAGADELRLTVAGETTVLKGATIRNDTLFVAGEAGHVALDDLQAVEIRTSDTGATVGLLVGIGALVALSLIELSNASYFEPGIFDDF